jgi:3-oxoadipate CoA-transferase alpha subunit
VINKVFHSADEALADVRDGSTILFGGFGTAGVPHELIDALCRHGAKHLTAVSNNCGFNGEGLEKLFALDRIDKMICSYPFTSGTVIFGEKYEAGKVKLELVPQGTLAERLRAGGCGIEAFYTPAGYGTEIAAGKETRDFDGRPCVLETAIRGDFAFIRAKKADRWGNLVYNKSGRNFNPLMAMAGKVTIAEVDEVVELGQLDPEVIVTPGIFVQRIVVRRGKG